VILTFGLHPAWLSQEENTNEIDQALQQLEKMGNQAHALGEMGLDYKICSENASLKDIQKRAFEEQLKIAKKLGKPTVFHIVRAHPDALKLLEKWAPFEHGGIVHSFSGSWEVAQNYLRLGFALSVSGVITRDGYEKLKRAIVKIPLDRLLVETDCPDQLPVLQGVSSDQLNEPAFLIEVARKIGQLRGLEWEDVLKQNTINLKKILKWDFEPKEELR
jgi:TatD DNase family protein